MAKETIDSKKEDKLFVDLFEAGYGEIVDFKGLKGKFEETKNTINSQEKEFDDFFKERVLDVLVRKFVKIREDAGVDLEKNDEAQKWLVGALLSAFGYYQKIKKEM